MTQIKILLLKYLKNRGSEGEIINVKAGYARNFLVPYGFGIHASRYNENQIKALVKSRELREVKELEEASVFAEKIKSVKLSITVNSGDNGKLFGIVSKNDIIKRYCELGIVLSKDSVHLQSPIKSLGNHEFQVKLHKDVHFSSVIEVVGEKKQAK